MNKVPEKEQNLWLNLSMLFENTPAESVVALLIAEGFTSIEAIRRTYFEIVAPGMSLLRVIGKNRQDSFSKKEILDVCFQFYRPRFVRPLVQLFGKYMCNKAGGIATRWEQLEDAFCKEAAKRQESGVKS